MAKSTRPFRRNISESEHSSQSAGRNLMDRYLVESPHGHENCTLVVERVHSIGYLHHFDWGCEDGRAPYFLDTLQHLEL